MSKFVGSKWKKTIAIQKDQHVARFIPETVVMTKESLSTLLDRYGMVYVKPEHGSYGNGVMRVTKLKTGYRYQHGRTIKNYSTISLMYAALLKETKRKRYLVQRGINLLAYNGRPFDLRVMVQLSPAKQWETTGIIGRIAAKGKIVTNYHNGGEVVTADRLLAPHTKKVHAKLKQLAELGIKTGRAMRKSFPDVYKIGLDIAMEPELKPWILEVNTSPDPYIFLKHPDKRIFRKIRSYEQANKNHSNTK